MLVAINELKKYLDFDLSPEEVRDLLTLKGLEVVGIKKFNPVKPGLVIAEIITKDKHPNADRLQVTEVQYIWNGQEKKASIVCGASNFFVGDKVVLATPGTILAGERKIKSTKIRGARSEGMLCSSEELGLEEKSEGILVLPEGVALTTPLTSVLGEDDHVLDLDLTTNRSDCLSVYGIARELAACLEKPLLPKPFQEQPKAKANFSQLNSKLSPGKVNGADDGAVDDFMEVEVSDPLGCPLYSACVIRDVVVQESPFWLKEKLLKHDVRSINNVVDLTNLMLLEYGQPMHAFDLHKIAGKIIVRSAFKNEKFVSLENKTYQLAESDLVIADEKKVIALAGVIGGHNSEVDENTKDIVLEAAYFNPQQVRLTSRKLQIASQASYYFARDVDGSQTLAHLGIAMEYMRELAEGKIGQVTERNNLVASNHEISLALSEVSRVLGITFSLDQVVGFLTRLHFKVTPQAGDVLLVEVPSFRKDVRHSWDLLEEVARFHGYEKFPHQMPAIKNANYELYQSKEDVARTWLKGLGYHEIITYPFIENDFFNKMVREREEWVAPENPLLKNMSILRKDLLFGMLKTIKTNGEKNQKEFNKAFEIGHVFSKRGEEYFEEEKIAFSGWGHRETFAWQQKDVFDFYDLKGDLEELLKCLKMNDFHLEESENGYFADGVAADVFCHGEKVGFLGLVAPKTLDYFEIKHKNIYFLEMSLSVLNKTPKRKIKYHEVSKYPSIARDLAIVTHKNKMIGDMMQEMKKHSKLLVKVVLGDVHQGKGLKEDEKSIVFHLEFCSLTKTLSKKEADLEVDKIVNGIGKKYEFKLR